MPGYSYRLAETAPPGAEPLELAAAKAHLRVSHDADDALIGTLISAARQACESYTGRALITRGYSLFLDAWRGRAVDLPRPPLVSVSRIDLYDDAGEAGEYASANYFVDTAGTKGRIVLRDAAPRPAPGRGASGIAILFTAGYGAEPQDVPAALRQGMKQLVAHLYENRGDHPAFALRSSGAAALFQPYRVMAI